MKRLIAAVMLLSLATFAQAQTVTFGPASNDPTMAICQVVVENQHDGDRSTDGDCIEATDQHVASLVAANPTPAQLYDTVADLVVRLAELAIADEVCDDFDDEIAEAIATAVAYLPQDDPNVAYLLEVGVSVAACNGGETNAIQQVPSRS